MHTDAKIAQFLTEFTNYIGHDYLMAKSLKLDMDTRFDQLNFDLVDEVITEHMISKVFNLQNWKQDVWPETVGSLLEIAQQANA